MAITEKRMIELLDKQKTDILNGIDERICVLENELEEAKKTASDALELAKSNQEAIKALHSHITNLVSENNDLKQAVDKQMDRSMRNTLVIKGLALGNNEQSWEDTEETLNKILLDNTDLDASHISRLFERVHRGKTSDKQPGPPLIFARCYDWRDTQMPISTFRNLNMKNKNLKVYVEQQHSPMITARQNEAMLVRKKLKKQNLIVSGFVQYPATLMVKKQGDSKYIRHSSY